MESESIKNRIKTLENEKQQLEQVLEQRIGEFFKELPQLAGEWIEQETRHQIEKKAKTVLTLAPERLSELKSKMKSLIGQLPEICDKMGKNTRNYPHLQNKDIYSPNQISNKEPYFASLFREAINHLGDILNEFGLVEIGPSATWKSVNGHYEYQINPGFDERKVESIRWYRVEKGKYEEICKEIAKSTANLEKVKAREIWDSVP
jgi:hypothetical protein